jgi:gamma-glutamyltranspeptidase/glutathione hydrolase
VLLLSIALLGSTTWAAASTIGWRAEGRGGAVAGGGEAAVAAGLSILEKGGNAVDAAAATLLASSISDYGSFAIGGEVSVLVYEHASGEVTAFSGVGGAPLDEEAIAWFYEHGIPAEGGIKTTPVPAALDLCVTLLETYGTLTFAEVVSPSLALLDAGGEMWYAPLAATLRKLVAAERAARGPREAGLRAARNRFYEGDIAEVLVAFYEREGGFLRREDLAAHRTRVEAPVTVDYRGYEVHKCDTWTQGPFLGQTLRLLEDYDLRAMGHLSPDYVHVLVEAMKLGFADRDRYYGDPRFISVPMTALLSDGYTRMRRSLIDMGEASHEVRPGDPINMQPVIPGGTYSPGEGGTTTCVVADRWGNLVAATPSANGPYAVCPKLGVAHGNRLRSMNTTAGHPNRIEPGKRPRITLTPTLVTKEGRGVIGISVAGGDLQDQTTLNVLLNHIEYGMLPDEAVTAPRFSTRHHEGSFNPNPKRREALGELGSLTLDARADEAVATELEARGHVVQRSFGPIALPVMIYIDPASGKMYAAGDSSAGRHAGVLEPARP